MAGKKISFSDAEKNLNGIDDIFSFKNEKKENKTHFEEIPIEEIKLDPKGEFQKLYPLEEENIQKIAQNMSKRGFRKIHALELITIEEEKSTFVGDGHNRLEAAIRAGISKVPVYRSSYATRKEAKIAMMECQLLRRNLSDSMKFKAVSAYMELKEGRSSEGNKLDEIASKTGMSRRQVAKISYIKNSGDTDLINAVENNEKSINQAYKEKHSTEEENRIENKSEEKQLFLEDAKNLVYKKEVRNPISEEILTFWKEYVETCGKQREEAFSADAFCSYLIKHFESIFAVEES